MNSLLTIIPLLQRHCSRRGGFRREFHQNRGAETRLTFNLNCTTYYVGHSACNRETQPEPGERTMNGVVHLLKRLENRIQLTLVNADSGIGNLEVQNSSVRRYTGCHSDFTHRSKLYGVVEYVLEDSFHFGTIADDRCAALWNVDCQSQILFPDG